MGANPNANGGLLLKDLAMPDFRDYAVQVSKPGSSNAEATRELGRFLRDVMKLKQTREIFACLAPTKLPRTGSTRSMK